MRPFSSVLPKPLMTIGNKPILERIFEYLHTYGIRRVFVTLCYQGHLIETYFHNGYGIPDDMEVTFVTEPEPLGTAGSLRLLPDITDPLLVMNADLFTNVNIAEMSRFHRTHNASMTICAYEECHQIAYGTLQLAPTGQVVGMQEKPILHYWINCGMYLLDPSVMRYLTPHTKIDMSDLIVGLLQAGEPVVAYPRKSKEFWFDIGDVTSHQQASEHFLQIQEEHERLEKLRLSTKQSYLPGTRNLTEDRLHASFIN